MASNNKKMTTALGAFMDGAKVVNAFRAEHAKVMVTIRDLQDKQAKESSEQAKRASDLEALGIDGLFVYEVKAPQGTMTFEFASWKDKKAFDDYITKEHEEVHRPLCLHLKYDHKLSSPWNHGTELDVDRFLRAKAPGHLEEQKIRFNTIANLAKGILSADPYVLFVKTGEPQPHCLLFVNEDECIAAEKRIKDAMKPHVGRRRPFIYERKVYDRKKMAHIPISWPQNTEGEVGRVIEKMINMLPKTAAPAVNKDRDRT